MEVGKFNGCSSLLPLVLPSPPAWQELLSAGAAAHVAAHVAAFVGVRAHCPRFRGSLSRCCCCPGAAAVPAGPAAAGGWAEEGERAGDGVVVC